MASVRDAHSDNFFPEFRENPAGISLAYIRDSHTDNYQLEDREIPTGIQRNLCQIFFHTYLLCTSEILIRVNFRPDFRQSLAGFSHSNQWKHTFEIVLQKKYGRN